MKTIAFVIALLLVLAACDSCTRAHAVDASAAWDSAAASHNFKTTAQVGGSDTFAQAWAPTSFPADFSADLGAMVSHVEGICGGAIAPPDGDELMLATLQNWN